ncbi:MAG: hypothetical protein ABH864_03055 [archaeon]
MEKKFQVMITFVVLVGLIAALYIFTNWFSIITGYFTGESQQESLIACLNEQGAEFYGTTFCADCARQEEQFGKAFEKINKIDCGKEMQNCPNLQEIPAWYIPNSPDKINYGFKTLNEISELAGCEPRG